MDPVGVAKMGATTMKIVDAVKPKSAWFTATRRTYRKAQAGLI